jgi:uncharacterized protein YyaL (SSP411 family)
LTRNSDARAVTADTLQRVLERVYAWSRARGYRGYDKHDGLNSPILRAALGWGRWPRLVAIQGVMRMPFNPRPLLLVPAVYNPKGISLFARGLLDMHRATGRREHLDEAIALLELLERLRSPGAWHGACWGYHYDWQDAGFYAPRDTPNAVVTSFVCEAYLDGFRLTGDARYLELVASAADFFLRDLTVLKDEAEELCLAYMPLPMTMRVMDVSMLIASVLAQFSSLAGDGRHAGTARRLFTYVVRRQTDEGAWWYADPPRDSHIRHDNYHTGFILDAMHRWMAASGDWSCRERYQAGLRFYAERLFNADGSPRWRSDADFPHDIHGAAQGILTFSRHPEEWPGLAPRIAAWALQRMYDPEGRFYYQQARWRRKKFTFMRWCNGWMAHALARLAVSLRDARGPAAAQPGRTP